MELNRAKLLKEKFNEILWNNYVTKEAFFRSRRANYKEYRRHYIKNIVIYHEDETVTKKPVDVFDKNYIDRIVSEANDIKDINSLEVRNMLFNLMDISYVKLERYMKECQDTEKTPTPEEIMDVVFGKNKAQTVSCLLNSIWSLCMYQVLVRNAEEEPLDAPNIVASDDEVKCIMEGDRGRRLNNPLTHEIIGKSQEKQETEISETQEISEEDIDFEKLSKLIVGVKDNRELVYYKREITEDEDKSTKWFPREEIIIINHEICDTLTDIEVEFLFTNIINQRYVRAITTSVKNGGGDAQEEFDKGYLENLIDRYLGLETRSFEEIWAERKKEK